jgi:hypothetical protein
LLTIKHTYKTKDRVTQTPLRTRGELRCSGSEDSSWCTSAIRRVNIVTNSVISREWGKAREVLTTSGTYPWSCVWTFHLCFATSQQHLHMEYISLRWYDITELVVPLRIVNVATYKWKVYNRTVILLSWEEPQAL